MRSEEVVEIYQALDKLGVAIWIDGGLKGALPEEGFYVKCDDENNPAEGLDLGQVVVDVGIAPVKPAEFVIFRVAQLQGGTSLVAE